MLSIGEIPKVHMPKKQIRQWRQTIQHRRKQVKHITRVKNSTRALLKSVGITKPGCSKSWWTKSNRNWMYQLCQESREPTSLVDNSYGNNAIGWVSKDHKFKNLTGSDRAQFKFTDNQGNTMLDITLDYLEGTDTYVDKHGKTKVDRNAPPYVSGLTGRDKSGVAVGDESDVLDSATSLEYNYDTFGSSYPGCFGKDSDSPLLAEDWVFDVIYEFKIDGDVFGNNGFGGVTIPIVHDSPNKIGKNKVYPDIYVVIPLPEPPAE